MENSSQSSTNPISQGCGTTNSQITIHVNPTTGGDFYINVEPDTSIENLKKIVSKRLKVPRDRICLLFRDKQLQEGSLVEYGISDGARITLLPNVETGLITQRPEIGIMQALESLNDTQVNEFLCGKAPLNLSMRLGDHMMLIQLQLSTVSGAKPTPNSNNNNSNSSSSTSSSINNIPPPTNPPSLLQASRNLQHTLRRLSADVFSGRNRGRRESVYSGTFSGALNPALQDPKGRPRRDVATIVHILNDLLCSVPELRRVTTTTTTTRRSNNTNTNNSTNGPSNTTEESLGVPETEQEENDIEPTSSSSSPSSSSSSLTTTTTSTTHHHHQTTAYCTEDQNLKTRGKLEHLRLVMGERRERRRQRKQKPYSLPPGDTDTVTA